MECLTQVICNGEEVLTVSGTKEKYVVDVWSGNHPFFKASSLSAAPCLFSKRALRESQTAAASVRCGVHCSKVLGCLSGLVCLLWGVKHNACVHPPGVWRAAHIGRGQSK